MPAFLTIGLSEEAKRVGQEFRRDTAAVVHNRKSGKSILRGDTHHNLACGGRRFDRVVKQVPDDLLQTYRVRMADQRIRLHHFQGNTPCGPTCSQGSHKIDN